MSRVLPRLRDELDILPSPLADRPGWIVRDPMGYSPDVILIPPWWARALGCFDGEKTEADLQFLLTRQNGGVLVPLDELQTFVDALETRGFLETDAFRALREARQEEFRRAPDRTPAHAGAGYPDSAAALEETFAGYFRDGSGVGAAEAPDLFAIAAPHVSPFGGRRSYAAAYHRLRPELSERTFVILGTSHYGEPDRFGLTRKPFVTPLGRVEVDGDLADALVSRAPDSVELEDYCHAVEHSIEFQVVFLQYALRRPFKILPILCGSFLTSFLTGEPPESNPHVERFVGALRDLAEAERSRLFFVLGVDMAHVGIRYGDGYEAVAHEGRLLDVAAQDRERIDRLVAADSREFLALVLRDRDPLKWCGFSALYTFLSAAGPAAGRLLSYEQWNIDPQSVVSFAGIEFSRPTS